MRLMNVAGLGEPALGMGGSEDGTDHFSALWVYILTVTSCFVPGLRGAPQAALH